MTQQPDVSASQPDVKWQPIMLIVNRRLECRCGNLAIFVTGDILPESHGSLYHVETWCQTCFKKVQEENDDAYQEEGD